MNEPETVQQVENDYLSSDCLDEVLIAESYKEDRTEFFHMLEEFKDM